jgi:hypothetical protein
MAYGTINVDKMVSSDGTTSGGLYGFKNRIINGAMMIDQRNAGASITLATGVQAYPVDRFPAYKGTSGATVTAQQSSTAPAGFVNSIVFTASTGATPAAGDVNGTWQTIEGYNVADLGWGTANAQSITISFWVRSSVTGTYSVSLTNSAVNRFYVATYTVNAANTWEQKTITVAGDTSGTWLTNNGFGIQIVWDLGYGTNFNGTAGAWGSSTIRRTSGSVQFVATTGATFYITGVQLEKGSTATSFDLRPYGTELALCQRYFVRLLGNSNYEMPPSGVIAANTTNAYGYIAVPVQLRALPSIAGSNYRLDRVVAGNAASAIAIDTGYNSVNAAGVNVTSSGLTSGLSYTVTAANTTSAYIYISAEL